MFKQSAGVIFEQARIISQSGYSEGDVWDHKPELLLAKNASARDNLNLPQRLVFPAEQMHQPLFIQTEIEARTDITQKRRTPFHNRLVSNLLPTAIGDLKPGPITLPKHRIHEFMLNLFGSHID